MKAEVVVFKLTLGSMSTTPWQHWEASWSCEYPTSLECRPLTDKIDENVKIEISPACQDEQSEHQWRVKKKKSKSKTFLSISCNWMRLEKMNKIDCVCAWITVSVRYGGYAACSEVRLHSDASCWRLSNAWTGDLPSLTKAPWDEPDPAGTCILKGRPVM